MMFAADDGSDIWSRDLSAGAPLVIGCQRGGHVSQGQAAPAVGLFTWEDLSA